MELVIALISAAVAIVVPSITIFLTKKKEVTFKQWEEKREVYRKFLNALVALLKSDRTNEEELEYALVSNAVNLIAPPPVLEAVFQFQKTLFLRSNSEDIEKAFQKVMISMREDLGSKNQLNSDFRFHLFHASGKNDR